MYSIMHSVTASLKRSRTGPLLAMAILWLLVSADSGCDRLVNVKNASSHAASVYVSIPEAGGRQLLRIDAGGDDAGQLGDSGVYTVYVMADDIVTNALKKTRDDLEAQLKTATTPAQIQDLTSKLQAISKLADNLANRSTSCGGKVADQGDAYVNIGWDDTRQMFTAACVSASPQDKKP